MGQILRSFPKRSERNAKKELTLLDQNEGGNFVEMAVEFKKALNA